MKSVLRAGEPRRRRSGGYGLGMPALTQLAWGLIIVVVDFRLDDMDVIPDPVGWVIAFVALTSLARHHHAFNWAAAACLPAGAISVPEWFGATGDLVTLVTTAAETVIVFATCTGLMAILPAVRRTAQWIRWWDLSLTLLVVTALLPERHLDEVRVLMVLAGIATLAVFVMFLLMLFRAGRAPAPAIAAD